MSNSVSSALSNPKSQSLYQPPGLHYKLNNEFSSLYQLIEQIGCGGYGFVMSALHRNTKQEVAVKFIYKEKLHSFTAEPLEITILKQIHHPTVIDYIDSFQDDNYFYLVMELYGCEWKYSGHESSSSASSISSPMTPDTEVTDQFPTCFPLPPQQKVRRSSCDLFECIERHIKLSESQTRKIFKQIVECVDDLSSIGIYHRDIKDENIVVDSNFKVKRKKKIAIIQTHMVYDGLLGQINRLRVGYTNTKRLFS